MTQRPVAILGAGLAGLAAARTLKRRGVPVLVFEAGPRIAGLAQSFQDEDGFSHDFGAHFTTNRLAATIGVGSRCRTVRHYAETVWLRGRTYGYPFGLMRSPRYALSGAWAQARALAPSPPRLPPRTGSGPAMARPSPTTSPSRWSRPGPAHPRTTLAASVGDKIPSSIFETVWLSLAARWTRRAVAIGYCRELPQSAHVWHTYPEGGVETLCRRLAEGLDDEIRTNTKVERILVEKDQVRAVQVQGQEIEVAAAVSTAPVNVLAKLVQGTEALHPLARFRYRPMLFVNLRLEGRGLLPDVVTWTPERDLPFFRLTEAPLSMPWLAPPGKTLITVDIGCEIGDAMWSKSDADLTQLCLDHLKPVVKDVQARYLGARVLRTPIAYPIFLREYEEDRLQFQTHDRRGGPRQRRPQRRVRPPPDGGRLLAHGQEDPPLRRRAAGRQHG